MISALKIFYHFLASFYTMPRNLIQFAWFKPDAKDDVLVGAIKKQGYFVFEEKLSDNDTQILVKSFDDLQDKYEIDNSGQQNGRIFRHGALGPFLNPYIRRFGEIASKYFGSVQTCIELSMFQISHVEMDLDDVPGGKFHMDDNKKNLKFFVYLTQVTERNGPFRYVPKSHGIGSASKVFNWWMWEITHSRRYLYAGEIDQDQLQTSAIEITGDAGTVFCADTTGFHAAKPLEMGERLVLVISFRPKRLLDSRALEVVNVAEGAY